MDMNLPTERRQIGEHTYTVTRLAFRESRLLLALSEQVLGPSLLQIVSEVDAKAALSSLVNMDASAAASALLQLLGRMGSADVDKIFATLGKATEVDDEGRTRRLDPETQDHWWALFPGECLAWIVFAFEVQYRDFFAGAGRRLSGALGELKASP